MAPNEPMYFIENDRTLIVRQHNGATLTRLGFFYKPGYREAANSGAGNGRPSAPWIQDSGKWTAGRRAVLRYVRTRDHLPDHITNKQQHLQINNSDHVSKRTD